MKWRSRTSRVAPFIGGRIRRAFSILELIVAIGILVLVTVGLAIVFDSVGDTVTNGRRVSALNRYVAQLEATMRRDFANIAPGSFMVIRQSFADGGNDVALSADQPAGDQRPRRVDEIMFFAQGDYRTARRSLSPELVASSNMARIYYGHGEKSVLDPANVSAIDDPGEEMNVAQSPYYIPRLGFDFSSGPQALLRDSIKLGRTPPPGAGYENPNRFASDWTLLRHTTLLIPPKNPYEQELPATLFGVNVTPVAEVTGSTANYVFLDKPNQVSFQPAVPSLFKSARLPTNTPDISQFIMRAFSSAYQASSYAEKVPSFSAGLTDIASTDLAHIEQVVITNPRTPLSTPPSARVPYFPSNYFGVGGFDGLNADHSAASTTAGGRQPMQATRLEQQAWMVDALPSEVYYFPSADGGVTDGPRIRTEDAPPLLLVPEAAINPANPSKAVERALLEADQEMLTAFGFVPRCTEFIVEWSDGRLDESINGKPYMVWFGPERQAAGAPSDVYAARHFNDINRDDFTANPNLAPPGSTLYATGNIRVKNATGTDPAVYTFGYINDNGEEVPLPRFVRVTIRVVDESDPLNEQTLRAVFELRQGVQ